MKQLILNFKNDKILEGCKEIIKMLLLVHGIFENKDYTFEIKEYIPGKFG